VRPGHVLLTIIRIWLPLAIAVAGGFLIAYGQALGSRGRYQRVADLAAMSAARVMRTTWMFRMSVESNRDREREEEARDYFARHGSWPNE